MNNEQQFYKKHPIITAILLILVSSVAARYLFPSQNALIVKEKEQVINNVNNYTVTIRNYGRAEISGLLNINTNDSFIKSIEVIKGNQYVTSSKVQDKAGNINFDLPKDAALEVKTVSDNVVVSHVELDMWYVKFKNRLKNLFKSKESNTSGN